jgi:hypothetical protein
VRPEPSDDPASFASPACSAHEMDDVYMGFAGREELLESLNELLEAERAGMRVALETAAEIEDPSVKRLVTETHCDGVRWCGVLTSAILSLKGTPSTRTGAFYEKAMAIEDLSQRLEFFNKGPAWIVCRLQTFLPRIRGEDIHKSIMAMLVSHQAAIERLEISQGKTGGSQFR